MIKENIKEIEERIQAACTRANRKREEVTLIAVSKTKPISLLEAAYSEGIRCFGENKVQELNEKIVKLPQDIHWHMIGHLQRNKVKYIVDKVSLIHSVDSIRLAEVIEAEAAKKNVIVDILLEVNVAEEDSKFGFRTEDVMENILEIAKLSHLRIKGLMTIAPYVENAEKNRSVFRTLKKLSVDIKDKNIDNVSSDVLSMGMTNDYEIAIEEGATVVRVGTGIFGEREYRN